MRNTESMAFKPPVKRVTTDIKVTVETLQAMKQQAAEETADTGKRVYQRDIVEKAVALYIKSYQSDKTNSS